MGQQQFLARVHATVRESAQAGGILDAYRLADELIAADLTYAISRPDAVRTILAAGVVYGAPMLLDPEETGLRAANAPADDEPPLLLSA